MAERFRWEGDAAERIRQTTPAAQPAPMFPDGADLPLFSGTPIPVVERPFVPQDHSMRQTMLPGMPAIDYDRVLQKDRALARRRHNSAGLLPAEDIFVVAIPPTIIATESAVEPVTPLDREVSAASPTKRERSSLRCPSKQGGS